MKFITIQDWQLGLGLSSSELLCYALIFGFSQDGESWFCGSQGYISEWIGVKPRMTANILKKLQEKGLLNKRERWESGVKYCDYQAIIPQPSVTDCNGMQKNTTESGQKGENPMQILHTPRANIAYHNIEDNNINSDMNKKENKKEKMQQIALPYHGEEFVATWGTLVKQPKWKRKTQSALQLSADKLGKYPEEEAVEMMRTSIANDWQGLFPLDERERKQIGSKNEESATAYALRKSAEAFGRIAQRYQQGEEEEQ